MSTSQTSTQIVHEKVNESKNHHKKPTKNPYKERSSRLDTKARDIDKSEFRGFFNMVVLCSILVFLSLEIQTIIYEGTVIGFETAIRTFERFDLFPAWLTLLFLSFSTFLLMKSIVVLKLNIFLAKIIHTMLISTVFSFSCGIVLIQQWGIVQTCFFLAETLVLLMKMHSYFATNLEYRAQSQTKQTNENEENNSKSIRYPQNINFWNYVDFLAVPTLCYELEYPRIQKLRISYLIEKIAQFGGIWACLHIIIHAYCLPTVLRINEMSILEALGHLIFPFMLVYLLIFYVIFDVICNGFAEITRFADREFYSDWWNSTTWDEFARKWNKPVHEWLLRHVYLESLNTYKVSSQSASLITFFASSIVHEFFMSMLLRKFKPLLFFFQMAQIPLIYIGRNKYVKGTKFGNYFFWFGLLVGPPLITLLYWKD